MKAYFSGLIVVIGSILMIPYFQSLIGKKFQFELSVGVKWLIVIIVLVVFFIGASNFSEVKNTKELEQKTAITETSNVDTELSQKLQESENDFQKCYDEFNLLYTSKKYSTALD